MHEAYLARLYEEARANGSLDDPLVADALARASLDLHVLRLHNLRTLTRLGRGEEPGPESSWIKLTWTTMTQGLSDAALLVTGRDPSSAEAGPWARQWLWSKAASIAGGTSQVQRDIIAGRILGLPTLTGAPAARGVRRNLFHARKGVVVPSGHQQPRRGENGSRRRERRR